MFNFSQVNNFEYGCASRGACSVSPNVYAIKAVMMTLLAQIAYLVIISENHINEYIIELLEIISNIDTTNDYSETQIIDIFSKQYSNYLSLKKEFQKQKSSKKCPSDKIKLKPNFSLVDIIQKGQKIIANLRKKISQDEKYMRDIYLNVLKSTAVNYLMLYEFERNENIANDIIRNFSQAFNSHLHIKSIKRHISILSKINSQIMDKLSSLYFAEFGEFSRVNVNSSTEKNKAILVSGDNLIEVKKVLEAVKDTEIDVYTNGNMLIAHAFKNLRKYKNLKGHFGNSQETMMLDFATFPGAILLTKRSFQNIDYLYRGRLFSSDIILPKGVKSLDNNYKDLIYSSDNARGFVKGQKRNTIKLGFELDMFEEKIIEIKEKLENNTCKKLIILGFGSNTSEEETYFKSLLKKVSEQNFVISFSHISNSKNALNINLANNYALLGVFLEKIFNHIPVNSEKLTFYMPKCDGCALSQIVFLRDIGVKNINISKCPPTAINPSVLNLFVKSFNLNFIPETA